MTIAITDHALLRWLERAYGMDFTAQRQELADLCAPYVAIRARHACVGVGLYATIVDGTVTTVLPERPTRRLEPLEGHVPEKLNWKAMQRKRNHR